MYGRNQHNIVKQLSSNLKNFFLIIEDAEELLIFPISEVQKVWMYLLVPFKITVIK